MSRINQITKKAVEILNQDRPNFWKKDWDMESLVETYLKYDQGSLSFTVTKLRHIGWREDFSIWEAIEGAKQIVDK